MNRVLIAVFTCTTMIATAMGISNLVPPDPWMTDVVTMTIMLSVVMWGVAHVVVPKNQVIGTLGGLACGLMVWVCYLCWNVGRSLASVFPRHSTLRQVVDAIYEAFKPPGQQSLIDPTPAILAGVGIVVITSLILALYAKRPMWVGVPVVVSWVVFVTYDSTGGMGWILATAMSYLFLIAQCRRHLVAPSGVSLLSVPVVVLAVVLSLSFPSVARGIPGWGDGFSWGSHQAPPDRTGLSTQGPLSVSDHLRSNSMEVMYFVQGDNIDVLSLTSYELFDGFTWTGTHPGMYGYNAGDMIWSDGFRTRQNQPAHGWEPAGEFQIRLASSKSTGLPTTPGPRSIIRTGGMEIRYEAGSDSFHSASDLVSGMTYTVGKSQFDPSVIHDVPQSWELYSQIVGSRQETPELAHSDQIKALTTKVVAGATTQDEMLTAIESYLRGRDFTYTLYPRWSSPDPVWGFLTTGNGYCIHFATAMAVMGSSVGIPMRVSVGYRVEGSAADSWKAVFSQQAHMWPEAYFEGVGWVRYEPTPSISPGEAGWSPPERSSPTEGSAASPAPPPEDTGPGAQDPESSLGLPQDTDTTRVGALVWVMIALAVIIGIGAWVVWVRSYTSERAWKTIMRYAVRRGILSPGTSVRCAVNLISGLSPGLSQELVTLRDHLESTRYGPHNVAEIGAQAPPVGFPLYRLARRVIHVLSRARPWK
ncbi:MAG: transglutaminase-like domain-containing protein [Propionibacteriaceae bacterium]|nr:transglutaminase-like domain-containing protein [Propionibacteriaceae bacterium]